MFRGVVITALLALSLPLLATPRVTRCGLLAQLSPKKPSNHETRRQPDAIDELIDYELNSNLQIFRVKPTEPYDIPYVDVPKGKVWIEKLSDTPAAVLRFFLGAKSVRWPKHPFNTETSVPFMKQKPDGEMTVQFTASRSLVFRLGGDRVYTIKLPTDHPHSPDREPFAGKADNVADATWSVATTRVIDEIDAKLRPDKDLLILREVLAVGDNKTWNGWTVRDLTPLKRSGNRYLPAFSIPFAGKKFSGFFGFSSFWKEHYSEALGRAKAKMLLRYGIVMATPNPQNFLVELTPDGRPTGRIVVRDIVDSHYVKGISEAIVGEERVKEDKHYTELQIDGKSNFCSHWRMDEEGKYIDGKAWKEAHDLSFIRTLEQALQKDLMVYQRSYILAPKVDVQKTFDNAYEFMKSKEGQAALLRYRESISK